MAESYAQPVPLDEVESSSGMSFTVTPVEAALAVIANKPAKASARIVLMFMAAFLPDVG